MIEVCSVDLPFSKRHARFDIVQVAPFFGKCAQPQVGAAKPVFGPVVAFARVAMSAQLLIRWLVYVPLDLAV